MYAYINEIISSEILMLIISISEQMQHFVAPLNMGWLASLKVLLYNLLNFQKLWSLTDKIQVQHFVASEIEAQESFNRDVDCNSQIFKIYAGLKEGWTCNILLHSLFSQFVNCAYLYFLGLISNFLISL